jgi:hypothetical protein
MKIVLKRDQHEFPGRFPALPLKVDTMLNGKKRAED